MSGLMWMIKLGVLEGGCGWSKMSVKTHGRRHVKRPSFS